MVKLPAAYGSVRTTIDQREWGIHTKPTWRVMGMTLSSGYGSHSESAKRIQQSTRCR